MWRELLALRAVDVLHELLLTHCRDPLVEVREAKRTKGASRRTNAVTIAPGSWTQGRQGLLDRSAAPVHGPPMETASARIIVHVFAQNAISGDQYARRHAETAQMIAAQGRRLVDLVIDLSPPKRDPAVHETLGRIARGEADGIALSALPFSIAPKKTADVLQSELEGPFQLLTAAPLADRGLLQGGRDTWASGPNVKTSLIRHRCPCRNRVPAHIEASAGGPRWADRPVMFQEYATLQMPSRDQIVLIVRRLVSDTRHTTKRVRVSLAGQTRLGSAKCLDGGFRIQLERKS